MPKFTVNRHNCDHGYWQVPDVEGGQMVTPDQMMLYHIGEREGRSVRAEEFRKLGFDFKPDNREDVGGHNVSGKVTIVYEFRKPGF